MIPGLATSWKTIDDTTWEFKLRKGVKFHDGTELTAEDVVFSIDRVPNVPNSPGPFSAYTKAIVAKEIVDPYTIRFKYAAPYPLAPNDLSTIYIVSKKAATGAIDRRLQHRQGGDRQRPLQVRQVQLRRPHRPRAQRQLLGREVAVGQGHVQDHQERVGARCGAALGRRRRDRAAADRRPRAHQGRPEVHGHVEDLAPRHLLQLRPPAAGRARSSPTRPASRWTRIRCSTSACAGRSRRRSTGQAIVDRVMEGQAIPSGQLVSEKLFGHVPGLKADAYDVEGAKKLLAEAGYPDGFNITIHGPSGPLRQRREDRPGGRADAVARRHRGQGRDRADGTVLRHARRSRSSASTWSAGARRPARRRVRCARCSRRSTATRAWAPSTGAATATSRSTT